MKSLLIVILTLALLAAAFFTRPSEASFAPYFNQLHPVEEKTNFFDKLKTQLEKSATKDVLTYKDKYLWVEMAKDGQTQYVGAFSHWFDKTQPTHNPLPGAPAK